MLKRFQSAISQVSGQAGAAALDLVFPAVCRLCDVGVGRTSDFCQRCETALRSSERMMESACPRCGRPSQSVVTGQLVATGQSDSIGQSLAESATAEDQDGPSVSACQRCKKQAFEFDRIVPLWAYLNLVRDAIVTAKYSHQSPLGDALGRRLAERVLAEHVPAQRIREDRAEDRPDVVTFVPSHFTRQLSRGGNGNLTIATAVATGIGRPCRQLLRITRQIEKQAWLNESERAKNVRGAFAPKKSYAFPSRSRGISGQQIAGRHILVVDDVLTTGATANEVARVLKDAGASRVTVAVVARAVS